MKKTWTRNDLIEDVSNNVGLPLLESSKIIEEIIEEILFSLEKGLDVKISSFGTFSIKNKRSRIGRNPKTGVEAPISARNVVTFNCSNILKAKFK
ncbi:HU family DNA-binding protein [Alphaproteobacteria bacterium]|nr:HU family DNA-binding protein [Alphaproteobacteria bacterium]